MSGKLHNNRGFSPVEAVFSICLFVIVAALSYIAALRAAATVHIPYVTPVANFVSYQEFQITPQTTYKGWQKYCSSFGDMCFQYPSDWSTSTATVGSNPAASMLIIKNPTQSVAVVYDPAYQQSNPIKGSFRNTLISVYSPVSTTDFKIVQAMTQNTAVTTKSAYYPDLFLTSNAVIKHYSIPTANLATAAYPEGSPLAFVNQKDTNVTTQALYVTTCSTNSTSLFTSQDAVSAWFTQSDVQTAAKILSSVAYP